jgi:UrcA family protein
MTKTLNFIAADVTGLSVSAFACTAAYAQYDEPKQVVVETTDLNLNSEAGQKVLKLRISRAARSVCGETGSRLGLSEQRLIDRCVAKSIANTTPDAPQLAAASTK